jgi:hypothetical protein
MSVARPLIYEAYFQRAEGAIISELDLWRESAIISY